MLCSNGGRVGDVADVAFVAKWVDGSCLLSPDVDRRVGMTHASGNFSCGTLTSPKGFGSCPILSAQN